MRSSLANECFRARLEQILLDQCFETTGLLPLQADAATAKCTAVRVVSTLPAACRIYSEVPQVRRDALFNIDAFRAS